MVEPPAGVRAADHLHVGPLPAPGVVAEGAGRLVVVQVAVLRPSQPHQGRLVAREEAGTGPPADHLVWLSSLAHGAGLPRMAAAARSRTAPVKSSWDEIWSTSR